MTKLRYVGKSTGGVQRVGRHQFADPVLPGDEVEVDSDVAKSLLEGGAWERASAKKKTEEVDG